MKDDIIYKKYHRKSDIDKSINSLLGLVEGLIIDTRINDREIGFLEAWLDDHSIKANKHPYNEIFAVVQPAIADGVITEEEKADILWLCNKFTSSEYFGKATGDMQKLHAILAGVAADSAISVTELNGLSLWLKEHEHLKKSYPYEEIESLIINVLEDKKISAEEHKMLMSFFRQFISILDDKTITNLAPLEENKIMGICAICPEINFSGSTFCFTGLSHTLLRKDFEQTIASLGGMASNTVTQSIDYLIIGNEGNPCWTFACYGRKIEKAMELRKRGHQILIVHENDFHDAVADQQ